MKDAIRFCGVINEVTPGNWSSKNCGTRFGSSSSEAKCEEGRKRVHVNDPS